MDVQCLHMYNSSAWFPLVLGSLHLQIPAERFQFRTIQLAKWRIQRKPFLDKMRFRTDLKASDTWLKHLREHPHFLDQFINLSHLFVLASHVFDSCRTSMTMTTIYIHITSSSFGKAFVTIERYKRKLCKSDETNWYDFNENTKCKEK